MLRSWRLQDLLMLACLLNVKFYFVNIDFTITIPSFPYFVNINLTSNTGRRNDMDMLLRKRDLLARQVIHQDKIYAKTLHSIPRHLSQVAGTQCIDRHWRSLKEFIGPAFPRKMKGQFGSKVHTEVNVLVKQWLYRMWSKSSSPKDVYTKLTQILK